MNKRLFALVFAFVLVLGGFGVPALAQTTGDIEGRVLDGNGAPLPGVSIEVKSPALQGGRAQVTDAQGRYRFPAVPPGVYSITGSLAGFAKSERTNIRVNLGATASINITMQVSLKPGISVKPFFRNIYRLMVYHNFPGFS